MKIYFKYLGLILLVFSFTTPAFAVVEKKVKVSTNDSTAGFLNGKLVGGTNTALVEGNDGGNETLTINVTAGTGSVTTVKEADAQVGGADIVTLDFGAGFDVAETPDTEVQVTLDLTEKQVVLTTEVTGVLPDANVANDITITNASQIADLNAGTNPANDLEEETHATEHLENAADELTVEALGTACAINLIPKSDGSGGLDCATDADSGGAPEGTAVLSTGEVGGNKFLREDGDGTSSWQTATATHDGTITWSGTSILETGAAFQFGDASDATLTHTYANTGTNVTIAYSSAAIAVTAALTATNLSGTNTGDNTVATTGDSATSFFSSGTIEEARLPAALTTAQGAVELATTAEIDTGTDTGRAISPDTLAASDHGIRYIQVLVTVDFDTDTAVADGGNYFHIPAALDGYDIVEVHAEVITAGTTNTTDVQIANVTSAADVLSTKLTIDSTETGSDTAATPAVIDAAEDDVAENDLLRFDQDAVSTTAAKGLIVTVGFRKP